MTPPAIATIKETELFRRLSFIRPYSCFLHKTAETTEEKEEAKQAIMCVLYLSGDRLHSLQFYLHKKILSTSFDYILLLCLVVGMSRMCACVRERERVGDRVSFSVKCVEPQLKSGGHGHSNTQTHIHTNTHTQCR